MVTSSTLKTLKKQDGSVSSREKPGPTRFSGLTDWAFAWWQSIWRRRWLSMITAWLICVVGWSVIALWPTSFVSSAVIYADLAHLADKGEVATQTDQTPAAMLKSLLLSGKVLENIQKTIVTDPAESGSMRDDIMLRSTAPPVFVLAYEHKSPDTAQQVIEALIAGYRQRLDRASDATLETAKALDEKINDHERRLLAAESDLADFKRNNTDYLKDTGSKQAELALLREELSSLEGRMGAATVDRDTVAAKLAALPGTGTAVEEVEAPRSLEELESERRALEDELAKLQERYADSHPYVVAVFDTIKTLDVEVLALTGPADGNVDTDEFPIDREGLEQRHGELIAEVSAINSRLEDKRREIELLQALTSTATSVEAEVSELEAKQQELKTTLSDFQHSRNELGEGFGGEATQETFRLIKQPELPVDPVGPSRLMALAAVLLGGTGLGAAFAVFCNRFKGVFESAWQLKKRFDVGVLGTISEVMTPAERKQLGYSRLTFGLACLALLGAFSGLAIAELTNKLAPLGEQLRIQILG